MGLGKDRIIELIEQKQQQYFEAADQIWDTPETRFDVLKSVQPFYDLLEKEGFEIEKEVANMKYAFTARFGQGDPVIGILAEYDALDQLSQVEDFDVQKQKHINGPGHGCGHNLLGIGALAGAVGIKDYMLENNLTGTIKLFGCPAEESGYGKAFMARDGVFDCLDVALTWHPMDLSGAWGMSTLAVCQAYFHFKGVAAHASASPEQGRSALDAAELMNIGVQFLREHIIDQGRIHYAFKDVGGASANVVQPSSSLYYFVRAPKMEEAQAIFERVKNVAKGAALMTDTELVVEFDSACFNYLPNKMLTTLMYENLKAYGRLDLTDEDQMYGQRYFKHLPNVVKEQLVERSKMLDPTISDDEAKRLSQLPYSQQMMPLQFTNSVNASTDVGDVSFVCPTAQVVVGCEVQGTPPHSWQWVASGKSNVAHKGLLAAGKVIATTAYDLLTNKSSIEEMKKEHQKTLNGKTYQSVIPKDIFPK